MIIVRAERPEDAAAVRRVNEQAFEQPDEANLVEALWARGKVTLSLVAVEEDRVIGHILFSPVTIECQNKRVAALGLGPMAVLPGFQRRGVGSLLVNKGLTECRGAGHNAVVVLGHPRFYPRFGFVPASRFGIRSEYEVADEVFMACELSEGALGDCAGLVKYQPEFNEV